MATKKFDANTEEKIMEAARKVFTHKGYAATRTRDIAEEAGINLALLNYYFRSKKKLFDLVMEEKIHTFFGGIFPILDNPNTSVEEKIETLTAFYIDMISQNTDLPIFVLNEIRSRPAEFGNIGKVRELIFKTHFMQQLKEKRPDVEPIQFLLSILGMIIFPFIALPVIENSGVLDKEKYREALMKRKELVPQWASAMLNET